MDVSDYIGSGALHDATVFKIIYDLTGKRNILLSVECSPYSNKQSKNGEQLQICFEDIIKVSFHGFGAIIGNEEIDRWDQLVSKSLESEISNLKEVGCACIGERFHILFQSGSILEGLCKKIYIVE